MIQSDKKEINDQHTGRESKQIDSITRVASGKLPVHNNLAAYPGPKHGSSHSVEEKAPIKNTNKYRKTRAEYKNETNLFFREGRFSSHYYLYFNQVVIYSAEKKEGKKQHQTK